MSAEVRSGQIFTSDMVISVFVFLVIVNISMIAWNQTYSQQDRLSEQRVMQQQGSYATNFLVRTPGYPPEWDTDSVEIAGLAEPNHVLQEDKLRKYADLTYGEQRGTLSVGAYELFINVSSQNQTITVPADDAGETDLILVFGQAPSPGTDITVHRRAVLVNASNLYERAMMEVLVWR